MSVTAMLTTCENSLQSTMVASTYLHSLFKIDQPQVRLIFKHATADLSLRLHAFLTCNQTEKVQKLNNFFHFFLENHSGSLC